MIGVVGLGFVGLTTALGFAHKNCKVYGFDISVDRMRSLAQGKVPFHEPDLQKYLRKYAGKKFMLCDSLALLVEQSKIIFFCVGTPGNCNGEADLGPLKAAVEQTLKFLTAKSGKVLVIKSTVPPLTASGEVSAWITTAGFKLGIDIGLANNPEFLREGKAWDDFIRPDRIVIGSDDPSSGKMAAKAYRGFKAPVHQVSLNSAEFIKYLSNCLLGTMISFSNEMALVAEAAGGIDIARSFQILHEDRRWHGKPAAMSSYAYPGCGFGGYCLPKDIQAMACFGDKKGCSMPILKATVTVNDKIKHSVARKVMAAAAKDDAIGILGLSFKPGSDDVRDTPARVIIRALLDEGFVNLTAHDPMAEANFKRLYDLPIKYADRLQDVTRNSKVLVLLTAWPEFQKNSALFKGKIVIDGRYCLKRKICP